MTDGIFFLQQQTSTGGETGHSEAQLLTHVKDILGRAAGLVMGRILELLLEEASMALGIGQNPVPAGFGQRSKAS